VFVQLLGLVDSRAPADLTNLYAGNLDLDEERRCRTDAVPSMC